MEVGFVMMGEKVKQEEGQGGSRERTEEELGNFNLGCKRRHAPSSTAAPRPQSKNIAIWDFLLLTLGCTRRYAPSGTAAS